MTEMTGGRVFPVSSLNDLAGHRRKDRNGAAKPICSGIQTKQRTATTAPGEKSRSSSRRPRACLPSTSTPRPATTRPTSSRSSWPRLAFLTALISAASLHAAVARSRAAASAAARLRPSTPPAPPNPAPGLRRRRAGYAIQREVNLVVLHASVLNDRGEFVPGLKEDNFRVLEDKVEQKLSVFQAGRRAGQHRPGDRQ